MIKVNGYDVDGTSYDFFVNNKKLSQSKVTSLQSDGRLVLKNQECATIEDDKTKRGTVWFALRPRCIHNFLPHTTKHFDEKNENVITKVYCARCLLVKEI